jgi:hypothetical protein
MTILRGFVFPLRSPVFVRFTASDDGMMSLSAKDAAGNSKVLMINIFPKE